MLERVDSSWRGILERALEVMDREYLEFLERGEGYIPKRESIFKAFETLSRDRTEYILFGQDPYPRAESATGYAFIDGRVKSIFSSEGRLSKEVNRATSLRNFIKMALVADTLLKCEDTSQEAISKIEKSKLINSIDDLRINFEQSGVLLLNTALIFTAKESSKENIKSWRGFLESMLESLKGDNLTLILFGTFAKEMRRRFDLDGFKIIEIEHPYNNSFICNEEARELFGEMHLLNSREL